MRDRTRRGLIYGLMIFLGIVIQTARSIHVSVLGVSPDCLAAIVTAIGIYEGAFWGGAAGVAAGIAASTFSRWSEGFQAAFLLFAGVFPATVGKKYVGSRFLSSVIIAPAVVFLRSLIDYVFYYRMVFSAPLGDGMIKVMLKVALSAPLSLLCIFIIDRVNKKYPERRE